MYHTCAVCLLWTEVDLDARKWGWSKFIINELDSRSKIIPKEKDIYDFQLGLMAQAYYFSHSEDWEESQIRTCLVIVHSKQA